MLRNHFNACHERNKSSQTSVKVYSFMLLRLFFPLLLIPPSPLRQVGRPPLPPHSARPSRNVPRIQRGEFRPVVFSPDLCGRGEAPFRGGRGPTAHTRLSIHLLAANLRLDTTHQGIYDSRIRNPLLGRGQLGRACPLSSVTHLDHRGTVYRGRRRSMCRCRSRES